MDPNTFQPNNNKENDNPTPKISSSSSLQPEPSLWNSRYISKSEKFARLPVWPAWNGVFLFLLSRIFGNSISAKLEHTIGGRVCPNFFQNHDQTSPFLMLVHHRHSFAPWDPLRFVQKSFFPEGFPSHPHRGFITVTYCLKGGMIHRDSIGTKQVYGAELRHGGKHTQWLMTGAGLLHEEMWDIEPDDGDNESGMVKVLRDWFQPSSQELYQLWVNVPSNKKMMAPSVELLGGDHSTPTVITKSTTSSNNNNKNSKKMEENGPMTKTIVICGEYAGEKASIEPLSDLSILHVQMDPGSTWSHTLPASHRTAILYMRTGTITMNGYNPETEDITVGNRILEAHYTAYLSSEGEYLTIHCPKELNDSGKDDKADFLLLTGEPLQEPVSAQGSMVMNSTEEINIAYSDYQRGNMGAPWDHQLTDEEWKVHNSKFPSRYNFEE